MKIGNALTLNTNSNIEIYSDGTFDTGQGLVNNFTQYAPAFKIYGLPTCTSMIFGTNAILAAWLYAPEASVSFLGSVTTPHDVIGSFICHDLSIGGRFNFHFDEALANYNPIGNMGYHLNQAFTLVPTPPFRFLPLAVRP